MRKLFILFPVFLLPAASAAIADDQSPLFEFYSDFCINEEGGDLLGTRIGVLNLYDATYVFFQEAEGVTEPPQIFKLKAGALTGNFTLRVDKQRVLDATRSDTAIDGHFRSGYMTARGRNTLHLQRLNSEPKPVPDC